MSVPYEKIINEVIEKQGITYDTAFVKKQKKSITVKDFIDATKKMPEWHKYLADALCDLQYEGGDILKFMKKFARAKLNI